MNRTDVLFIVPGNNKKVFQGLGSDFAAIEPPAQAGLFANYLRMTKGCSVGIIDVPAMGVKMSLDAVAGLVSSYKPYLVVMIVYGQQPSASTQNMPAARLVCEVIREKIPDVKILMTGTHPAALPSRTLMEEPVDFVCDGEGPVTIYETLKVIKSGTNDFHKVSNLWYWKDDYPTRSGISSPLIASLDEEFMHGIAWDLLPMGNYRAHNWHCFDDVSKRSPYASIHTSFGCPFSCVFCCINAPFGKSSYRMFSPEHVIREIDILVNKYGVRNIKFIDELFVLNEEHVAGICDLIISRGYALNIWAYARVDTVQEKLLEKLRNAGVRWLALGIESGSSHVRDGKKRFSNEEAVNIAKKIQNAGIYVVANYIFGLPDDTLETMQETLNLAIEINSEWANFYCAMAYPGSKLYDFAKKNNMPLPDNDGGPGWIGYSQYAYDCLPLLTDHLSAAEVLKFRDVAFYKYFTNKKYLEMIQSKFGEKAVEHINQMTSIPPLMRKLLEKK